MKIHLSKKEIFSMLQIAIAFIASFLIQLAICNINKKVIVKLLSLLIEITIFVTLVVISILTTHQEAYYEIRIMIGFYAFVVFIGLIGIGLAWIIYAVIWAIYKR